MNRTVQVITAVAMFALAALPVSAAIYMKVEGVEGHATAAGKEKWIELGSIQFLAGSAKGTMNPPLSRLCASRAPLPTVAVEIDGESHTLREVQFTECRTAGETMTFTIAFSGPAPRARLPKTYDHALGGGTFSGQTSEAAKWDKPNATVSGLTPARTSVRLLSTKVRGNKATVVVAVPQTLTFPSPAAASAPSVSEIVVTKLDGGSWSYSGSHVLYQDVAIPATARGTSRVVELTIEFESMQGSRADYADPESPLPAGR